MKLETRVLIAPADPSADPHSFLATATNLNRYGALIRSDQEFHVSSQVLLTNQQKQTAIAKVVKRFGEGKAFRRYGIEFVEGETGATFWGITFLSDGNV
jgi:hypothetical protein